MIIRRQDYEALQASIASLRESFDKMKKTSEGWKDLYEREKARNRANQ